jgi:hypothetical protein
VITAGENARDFCHVPRTNDFFMNLSFGLQPPLQSIAELLKRVKCPSATESAEYNIRGGRIWCSMSRPGQRHCGLYQTRQTS